MKRTNNLFPLILDWDNLNHAVWRAAKGKRQRKEAQAFLLDCNQNLRAMQCQISNHEFDFGHYRQFQIRDPKPRTITAPAFSERVVHHAIVSVCEPHFERFLVDQTYACRNGKGRIAAIEQAHKFANRHKWYLKLDIRSYFDSVDHCRLITLLERRFKDPDLLRLFEQIITSFSTDHARGLPIGSLTSQHLANFYLGWMDHFVKHHIRCRGYVRYMDDFVIWSHSIDQLREFRQLLRRWLLDELSLELKRLSDPQKTESGMNFLGCQIFPNRICLNRRNRNRVASELRRLENFVRVTNCLEAQQRLTTFSDFASQATTDRLSW